MKDLTIKSIDGEDRVSTLTIAEQEGMPEHRAILQLLENYQADFNELGSLAFEMRKSAGRPTRYAMLNERQATLLFTYMRNTDPVREFKMRLVSEFYKLAKAKEIETTPLALVPAEIGEKTVTSMVRMALTQGVPHHVALQLAGEQATRETGIRFDVLLSHSKYMDAIKEEEIMLEPTELGKHFGISGRKMNSLLENMGYQRRNANGLWEPTEKAKGLYIKHAWVKGNKSGYNLKWKLSEFVTKH